MDKLATFQNNDPRRLFELTKKLNERHFFEVFLNETQFKIINHIVSLNNFEIWTNFLEGNCYISYVKDQDEVEAKAKENDQERIEKPVLENVDESESDQAESKDIPDGQIKEDNNNNNTPNESKPSETKKVDESVREIVATEEAPETVFPEGADMSRKLALHIRYLLWEKAIDFYYNTKELDQSLHVIEEVTDDYELIDSLDNVEDGEKDDTSEKQKEQEKPKVREEEDDYDDDDDDDEEEEKKDELAKEDVTEKSDSMLTYNSNDQLVLEIPLSVFRSKPPVEETPEQPDKEQSQQPSEPPQEPTKQPEANHEDQEKLFREFNKVYHNFEYDRETLLKRRKLEKSDMQLEDKKGGKSDSLENSKSHAQMDINLGAGSTSLQHLLATIQLKREEVPLNDHELRNLFMDVRKNRGKWANDDRIGQEELYEACEKVVTELRGYTEHSTFFLNKVSKREAPNYGLIIKKPMDLNTVMKKLKNLAYNSKQEFVDDLMLIWSNCLTYNADPKHFIRAHAVAMQKKTAKLVPIIPDITVRSRAEVEKEEEVENDKKGDELSGGKSMKKGRKRQRQDEIKAEQEAAQSPSAAGTPLPSAVVDNATPAPHENGNVSNDEEEEEEEDNDNMNGAATSNTIAEEDEEEFDPELQSWKILTAKSRANYCAQRADLFDEEGRLRTDAPAILRESNEMSNFNQYLSNKEVISKATSLLENDEPYLLEYDITGGVPGMKYKGVDKEEEDKYENKLVDIYLQQADGDASKIKSDFVMSTQSGLNKIYFENICEMQEIRKICFKISLIRQMQTQQFVHHTQMKQPEIQVLKEVDIDDASKLPNHDSSTKDVQFAVLRRNIAKIAMQTGFETTQPAAINTLAQVAEKYLGNLIKSLKLHSETASENRLSTREILLLSLLENGVDRPDDLYTFIKERIMKQQDKLKDLRVKLSNFLKDLLRPGLENFNEKSFDDNSEQFVTGDFSNGLGDDFFGFKELGLDKEFKMLTSSIPIYLLHSRLHNQYATSGGVSQRNKYEDLQEYEPGKIHGNEVEKQIGLLVPFYKKLYERSQTHYIKLQKKKGENLDLPADNVFILIEDEELPQKQRNIRPKMPPTGKITSIKKKIIASSFFLPEEEDLLKQEQEEAEAKRKAEEEEKAKPLEEPPKPDEPTVEKPAEEPNPTEEAPPAPEEPKFDKPEDLPQIPEVDSLLLDITGKEQGDSIDFDNIDGSLPLMEAFNDESLGGSLDINSKLDDSLSANLDDTTS
ncbi:Transcriptional activator SPT7 [Candida viswanathii]|uniref:SAGA complex subunit Spt7 n=1 Tax=Candida viswanathii TaxID=5486 RepID=A0A367YJN0_9ASCO|nr:Transcriptional activator SPT7 [Candida viswanathii]